MKIHLYGNTLNGNYFICKLLRDNGHDAHLFLDRTSNYQQDYPWWDDPTLTIANLPSWIHFYDFMPFFVFPGKKTRKLIYDFSNCDVALVSCFGPILAMKSKVPFLFLSVGSDLNGADYSDEYRCLIYSTIGFKARIRKFIKLITYIPLQRKALVQYCSRVVIAMGYQQAYVDRLGITSKTKKILYPKNVIHYKKMMHVGKQKIENLEKYEYVFMMISRLNWKSVWNDIKGNDKFIRAYARYIKQHNSNSVLLLPRKGIDLDATVALIQQLDISGNVIFFDDMPKYELACYQKMNNVIVVDNFWHDNWYKRYPEQRSNVKVGFGFGSIESLAMGRPLITAFKDLEFYDNQIAPILYAFSEEEIYSRIEQVHSMSQKELSEMGENGYEFVKKWHEQTTLIKQYEKELKEISEVENIYGLH